MNKEDLTQCVLTCYEQTKKTEKNGIPNWCNLAHLGKCLSSNGISYKDFKYSRLKDFIRSLGIFEEYQDDAGKVPVLYIRFSGAKDTKLCSNLNSPKLFEWAYMGNWNENLQKLAGDALEEKWSSSANDKLDILDSYLKYTFAKLLNENKICYARDSRSEDYAVFNTGLVNQLYKPIYALFKKNKKGIRPQQWYYVDFCVAGEKKSGKTVVDLFEELPKRANYFTQLSDLFYDASKGVPKLDDNHIFIQNIDRFPYDVLKEFQPSGCEVKSVVDLTDDEKEEYFNNLRQAMQSDKYMYRRFIVSVHNVVKLAVDRVEWNYKTAIPMYYFPGGAHNQELKEGKISLLLPLTFGRDDKVELALVVSKCKGGMYQGETIYPLEWAYKCARLVCRPDSDWLSADNILPTQREETE